MYRLNAALPRLDANDLLYQLDASREYNPLPKLETIKAPLLNELLKNSER